jgi:nicotinamidase-related amidase
VKPILVVIDIQKEYVTEGRPYFIAGIGPSLERAKGVLSAARADGWDVVHVRHLQDGDVFGRDSAYSGFVAGFEPRKGEAEIVKGDYSCYSAPEFARLMKDNLARPVYVIGYGSTKCCLATIVDGYHRGQKFFYVADASNAKRSERFDEKSLHAHATDILKSYCTVVASDALAGT